MRSRIPAVAGLGVVIGVLWSAIQGIYFVVDASSNLSYAKEQNARWRQWLDVAFDPWWLLLGVVVVFVFGLIFLGSKTTWGESILTGSAFRVRCQSEPWHTLLKAGEAYAQLAITNTGPGILRKCAVRVVDVLPVANGQPQIQQKWLQSRPLQWSSRESAYGQHMAWLDIPNDGHEYLLDVAAVAKGREGYFCIVSANHADRPIFPAGQYKLIAVLSSQVDAPNVKKLALRLTLRPGGTMPAQPLLLEEWN